MAKLGKLADKFCNINDLLNSPPAGWSFERKQETLYGQNRWLTACVERMQPLKENMMKYFELAKIFWK